MQGVLRTSGKPAKIKLRATVKGLPAGAEVEITDFMFQPDQAVSGWLPHVTELPWSAGMTYLNTAPGGELVYWDDIKERPVVFPPAVHTHSLESLPGKLRMSQLDTADASAGDVIGFDGSAVGWVEGGGSGGGQGDTGWQILAVESGALVIRRVGNLVEVRLVNYRPQTPGTVVIAELPDGYRPHETVTPTGTVTSVLATAWESAGPRRMFARAYAPYKLEAQGLDAAGSWLHANFSFLTDDDWPAP